MERSLKRFVILIIILVIVSGFIFVVMTSEIFHPPQPGMSVTRINETGIPDGEIIALNEEDFSKYPSLAPIIRDQTRQDFYSLKNGTRIDYYVSLPWNEYNSIVNSRFFTPTPRFYEYQGDYYSVGPRFHGPEITITKLNKSNTTIGEIILLTENDFQEFPSLALVIRDNTQEGTLSDNGTRTEYHVNLTRMENGKIWYSKLFSPRPRFFEYRGTYYEFGVPWIP